MIADCSLDVIMKHSWLCTILLHNAMGIHLCTFKPLSWGPRTMPLSLDLFPF